SLALSSGAAVRWIVPYTARDHALAPFTDVCQESGARKFFSRVTQNCVDSLNDVRCRIALLATFGQGQISMVSIDDRLNQIIRELIGNGITLEQAVEAFEGKYIVAAMSASRGNVTQASKALGVHRNTLHNKLRT